VIAFTGAGSELSAQEQVHVMTISGEQDRVLGHFGWYGFWTASP